MPTKLPSVYVVSDSIGETAEFVVRAAGSQFANNSFQLRKFTGVKDFETLDRIVQMAADDGGFIAFTIVLKPLRERFVDHATTYGVPIVDIMGPMLQAYENMLHQAPIGKPGLIHQLDADYFRRIEAVEFAVKYDDGRDAKGIERADLILIGVSRTSKTPLSMYLAHRQLRVANVPIVPEVPPSDVLFQLRDSHKMIGLTIHPDKLKAIRRARLETLGIGSHATYADAKRILEELAFADDIMTSLGCYVIDVTDRAVEETASLILDYWKTRLSHESTSYNG